MGLSEEGEPFIFLQSTPRNPRIRIMKTTSTGYWTFFCNPKIWQIDAFLHSGETEDTFKIQEWQEEFFQPGQLGVIRVGNDSRNLAELAGKTRLKPRIYALVEITSTPRLLPESETYYLHFNKKRHQSVLRVEIKYLKNLIDNPLTFDNIRHDEALATDPYLLKGFQGSSMPLQENAFKRVVEMLDDDFSFEHQGLKETTEIKKVVRKRVLGHIPDFAEGYCFESRKLLSEAGVHRPTQAGISGGHKEGADSIVLSGGSMVRSLFAKQAI